jgi:hypothetical protein
MANGDCKGNNMQQEMVFKELAGFLKELDHTSMFIENKSILLVGNKEVETEGENNKEELWEKLMEVAKKVCEEV